MDEVNICSFNMHGINQGEEMVITLLNEYNIDCLFLQEHWLSSDNLYRLCSMNPNYLCFGVSAMDNVLENGVLFGRPFGGVATLIHDSFKHSIVNHKCSDRYNILSIGNVTLVNVYVPSNVKVSEIDIITEMWEDIHLILDTLDYKF